MAKNRVISITEARKNIFDIAEDVQFPGTYYTLTEKGRGKAVLMSVEEFESWQETMEVLADNPDLLKETRQAEEEYELGKTTSLEDYLKEKGYMKLSDVNPPNKKHVQSRTKRKSKKATK